MEPCEGVVQHRCVLQPSDDAVHANVQAVVDAETAVIDMVVVAIDVSCIFSATKTLLFAVLVNAPQVFNTLASLLRVNVPAQKSGCNGEKSHVLESQLEDG